MGFFIIGFFVLLLAGAWWLLRRALTADEQPTGGGSFGDLALGEKNRGHRPDQEDEPQKRG